MPRFPWALASVRFTRALVLLPSAPTATMGIIRTLAHRMVITGQTGSQAACLSAPALGITVTGDAATMAAATTDEAGMVAPAMAIDPDMVTGRAMVMAGRVTGTGIGLYLGVDIAELPEAATTVVMRVAGITATLPEASMAVAAFTVAVEDSTAVAEAMAAVATGN
jgi:hypothetical protein